MVSNFIFCVIPSLFGDLDDCGMLMYVFWISL